jgi:hypothetical protein
MRSLGLISSPVQPLLIGRDECSRNQCIWGHLGVGGMCVDNSLRLLCTAWRVCIASLLQNL